MTSAHDETRALQEVREQIRATFDDEHDVAVAPLTLDEAFARIDADIAERATTVDRNGIELLGAAGYARPVGPDGRVGPHGSLMFDDPLQLALLLQPDAVRDLLRQGVRDYLATTPEPLDAETRAESLREIRGRRRDLEEREESLVRALEADGLDVLRRVDADPEIVLAGEIGAEPTSPLEAA